MTKVGLCWFHTMVFPDIHCMTAPILWTYHKPYWYAFGSLEYLYTPGLTSLKRNPMSWQLEAHNLFQKRSWILFLFKIVSNSIAIHESMRTILLFSTSNSVSAIFFSWNKLLLKPLKPPGKLLWCCIWIQTASCFRHHLGTIIWKTQYVCTFAPYLERRTMLK